MKRRLLSLVLCAVMLIAAVPVRAAEKTYREISFSAQYRATGTAEWKKLTPTTVFGGTDGIRIYTEGIPFHVRYLCRDVSHGWMGWQRSYASGTQDFAGWPGESVTNITLTVCGASGTKYDGALVLYRTRCAGEWLDWVSDTTEAEAKAVMSEYGIKGQLDADAGDAGWASRGVIEGLEIRIFERAAEYPAPAKDAVIIDAPYIYQYYDWPNGCEAVSAVMALKWLGIKTDVDKFIADCLPMGSAPDMKKKTGPDPAKVYCGDPRTLLGWGCFAPVIASAAKKAVSGTKYTVRDLSGTELDMLCAEYIDRGIPVIVWDTVGMVYNDSKDVFAHWKTKDGKDIAYNRNQHCMLLVGYDAKNYFFNDPAHKGTGGRVVTGYAKDKVEKAYAQLGKQAVAVFDKALFEVRVDDPGPGDVNADGKVNLADIALMMKYNAGWKVSPVMESADVNADRKVSLADVTLMIRYCAGWDVELKEAPPPEDTTAPEDTTEPEDTTGAEGTTEADVTEADATA